MNKECLEKMDFFFLFFLLLGLVFCLCVWSYRTYQNLIITLPQKHTLLALLIAVIHPAHRSIMSFLGEHLTA